MVASRAKETKQQVLLFFKLHVHFNGYRQSLEATNKAHTNCYIPVSRYSTDDLRSSIVINTNRMLTCQGNIAWVHRYMCNRWDKTCQDSLLRSHGRCYLMALCCLYTIRVRLNKKAAMHVHVLRSVLVDDIQVQSRMLIYIAYLSSR